MGLCGWTVLFSGRDMLANMALRATNQKVFRTKEQKSDCTGTIIVQHFRPLHNYWKLYKNVAILNFLSFSCVLSKMKNN